VPRSGAPGEGRPPQGFPNPHLIALCAICPLPQGERVNANVLATHMHRSFVLGEAQFGEHCLRYSPSPFAFFFPLTKEGKQNADRCVVQPPRLRARRALIAARSPVGVPPRFSPKGVFHPKDSASGQASWDLVCAGVTRLRLSQSRDAPPTPVMVPGDMMPKPPGSGLQIRPRAPHPAPPFSLPPKGVL